MEQNLSLRIDNGIRVINVNDNGDTITLKLGDSEFQKKGIEIYDTLIKELKNLEDITTETTENTQKIEEFRKHIVKSIDEWIGNDTCYKIFGDISPSLDLITILFDELMPFIEDYNINREKRTQKITAKYNPARKGQ